MIVTEPVPEVPLALILFPDKTPMPLLLVLAFVILTGVRLIVVSFERISTWMSLNASFPPAWSPKNRNSMKPVSTFPPFAGTPEEIRHRCRSIDPEDDSTHVRFRIDVGFLNRLVGDRQVFGICPWDAAEQYCKSLLSCVLPTAVYLVWNCNTTCKAFRGQP